MWLLIYKIHFRPIRKNLHGIILGGKPKEQHLSIVPKSCPIHTHTHTHTQHNKLCYSIIEFHYPLMFYLLFSFFFKLFLSLLPAKKKIKTFSSPHLRLHLTFSFLFTSLPHPLLSTSSLHFFQHFLFLLT